MEPSKIFLALMIRGYFPPEIPPVFTSRSFAMQCSDLVTKWQDPPATKPERYSYARFGLRRRDMQIPNPVNQMVVADVVAGNWQAIEKHCQVSKLSKSRVGISEPKTSSPNDRTRAVTMPFKALESARLLKMAGHSHILKTDINRFFPSVYTHGIAWALHGKAEAKKRRQCKELLGNRLDYVLRQGNDQQTTGIPVGPSTSTIIAEVIMSSIDEKVQKKLGSKLKDGYRLVDDYFLCFDSKEDAESALAAVKDAADYYGLAVNDEKTAIMDNMEYTEDLWPNKLRMIESERKERIKRERMGKRVYAYFMEWVGHWFSPGYAKRKAAEEKRWLMQFASETFALANKHGDKSVMKYALPILRGLTLPKYGGARLRTDNWELYESILIRIMVAYPYTADAVAAILRECRDKYPLNKGKLSDIASLLIARHARQGHHSETAWSLWLAKVVGLRIAENAAKQLPETQSGVCALLALDCMDKGVIKREDVDIGRWENYLLQDGLEKECWLLAYEAPQKGWLGDVHFIDDHDFFAVLKERGVSFYDQDNNAADPTIEESYG